MVSHSYRSQIGTRVPNPDTAGRACPRCSIERLPCYELRETAGSRLARLVSVCALISICRVLISRCIRRICTVTWRRYNGSA